VVFWIKFEAGDIGVLAVSVAGIAGDPEENYG